jgi:hypothetical protein
MPASSPRTRAAHRYLAILGAIASLAAAADAHAFCRTMACKLPADFSPSPGSCVPPDFASYCASLDPPANPIPVWWRNACVGYDLQENASAQVPYPVADSMFATAFGKWTSTVCPVADATDDGGTGSARVSIDVRDLGPVVCNQVQYNSDQGNQHVILFHDDVWPYDDANNTLGLTTVTYDPDTGEIYDADMEINATVQLAISDPVPADGYDLASIITHECGHFLGMAHSGADRATMFAHYTAGSTYMRELTSDDVAGICSIYLPGGERAVDPSATSDGSGLVPEDACDPTPRHGFAVDCATSAKHGCTVGPGSSAPSRAPALAGLALAATLVRRARRRGERRPA